VPTIEFPFAVTSVTLPSFTCCTNVGRYGIVTRGFSAAAKITVTIR
jgi:hypothetical protein